MAIHLSPSQPLTVHLLAYLFVVWAALFAPILHVFCQEYKTLTPQDNDDLKTALCSNIQNGECKDDSFVRIMITKTFDFTNERMTEARGCWHKSSEVCRERGQMRLDEAGMCANRNPVDKVKYSELGREGLVVGSNKQIVGNSENSGIRGAGLRLRNVNNVLVKSIRITDINPHLVCGGDGINIHNSRKVVINGNYFKNIGHHMIATSGKNGHVIIKRNVFDGETKHSTFCDGRHYWLWFFNGEEDHITLALNDINSVSGRAPLVGALPNSNVLVHVLQNTFYDINRPLVFAESTHAKLFMESNAFHRVGQIVANNFGHIFFATNNNAKQCRSILGRLCYPNQGNSGGEFDDGVTIKQSEVAKEAMTNWKEGKVYGPTSNPTGDKDNLRPEWKTMPHDVLKNIQKL